MSRRLAVVCALMMAFSAFVPLLCVTAESDGTAPAGSRDPSLPLTVSTDYTVSGSENWKSVTIQSGGTLKILKDSLLVTTNVNMQGGSLLVTGGTLVVTSTVPGDQSVIRGTALYLNLTKGAMLQFSAPGGGNTTATSQGGAAGINVSITGAATIDGASITAAGGAGFVLSSPWVVNQPLKGYVSAGGPAQLEMKAQAGAKILVRSAAIQLTGGAGAKAPDGQNAVGNAGGKGGGYSDGGEVSEYVGSGGRATLLLDGPDVVLENSSLTGSGGPGGDAGNGGSAGSGGGGGGGYGGGAGSDYGSSGSGTAGKDALVTGFIGTGGPADITLTGASLKVTNFTANCYGGNGGKAGTGGDASPYAGGGGAGYAGGGGGGSVAGYGSGANGGAGSVSGAIGSGGRSLTTIKANHADIHMLTLMTTGGNGGAAGAGGKAYQTGYNGYAGAGGGGYGGGGGGSYSTGGGTGGSGGNGMASGWVGGGGNASLKLDNKVLNMTKSYAFLFGGTGGTGGNGGDGGYYAGGGGAGYGGGGGAAYSWSNSVAGTGTASGDCGVGGNADILITYFFGSGQAYASGCSLRMIGGRGGSTGAGGKSSGYGGGGGGGFGGGGGGGYSWQGGSGGAGTVNGNVGDGGDANLKVFNVVHSIARENDFQVIGGERGDGKSAKGEQSGGTGTGRATQMGDFVIDIPMGMPRMLEPADGEVVNAVAPTFTWTSLYASTTDGEVSLYFIQIDNQTDFSSPEVDLDTGTYTTFTPSYELRTGGAFSWRVMAVYVSEGTTGYTEARTLYMNTPPILRKNLGLKTVEEDVGATHLYDLNDYFWEDVYPNSLTYTVVYESDPTKLMAIIDGHYLDFYTMTPNWTGQQRFRVRASDPMQLSVDSNNFTVRVTPIPDSPFVSPMPRLHLTENKEYLFDMTPYIYDSDSRVEDLTVTTSSEYAVPSGLTLILKYPAGVLQDLIEINVTDTMNTASRFLEVEIAPFNDPPYIRNIQPFTTTEDKTARFSLVQFGNDEEDEPSQMTWNVTRVDAGSAAIFNSRIVNGSTLVIEPLPNAFGAGSIQLTLIDSGGKEAFKTVSVTISAVNDPPRISELPDVRVMTDRPWNIDLGRYIADVDSPLSEVRVNADQPQATLDGFMLTLRYPGDFPSNESNVKITASDGIDTTEVTLIVQVTFPPSIKERMPDIVVMSDKTKTVQLSNYGQDREDPEAAMSWEISDINELLFAAYIDPNTHVLTIMPKKAGRDEVTLTLTDSDGGQVTQTLLVTVKEAQKKTEIPLSLIMLAGLMVTAGVLGAVLFVASRPKKRT